MKGKAEFNQHFFFRREIIVFKSKLSFFLTASKRYPTPSRSNNSMAFLASSRPITSSLVCPRWKVVWNMGRLIIYSEMNPDGNRLIDPFLG